jgi:hypothetical protein
VVSGLLAWTLLVGTVSSEIFEQLGEPLAHVELLSDAAVALGERLLSGDPGSPEHPALR